MLRKAALALLVVVAVSQVADAGPVKFSLTPVDSGSSAGGTLRIVNGKPTDVMCSVHFSVAGLTPGGSYVLKVYGPDNALPLWSIGVFADANGACTFRGTTTSEALSATRAEVEEMSGRAVLIGK